MSRQSTNADMVSQLQLGILPEPPSEATPSLPMSPVHVDLIMNASELDELMDVCDNLGLSTDNCDDISSIQNQLLEHFGQTYRLPPPVPAVSLSTGLAR